MAARDQRAMVSEEVAPVLLTKTLSSFDLAVIFIGIVLVIVNSAGFQFAGLVWLFRGHPAQNSFSSNWNPLSYANVTVFAFAFLALLGIEVPLNMGAEIKDEKSIRHYLLWGSLIVMVAYLATTWSTMVVI